MKTYFGISRDHSGSMRSIARAAARDYNSLIADIQENSAATQIDTIVSVVECGVGVRGSIERVVTNSNVQTLQPINESSYVADGHYTPLFDSVGELIEQLERTPDAHDPEVNFCVMAVTDGQDNSSRVWRSKLGQKIRELQNTDRWTFIFRVPRGYARQLESIGIPRGNILEWDQTDRGVAQASQTTQVAMKSFYEGTKSGTKATKNFYSTDMTGVTASQIKKALVDISGQVTIWNVEAKDDAKQIRIFCEERLNHDMKRGAAFYLLMKPENEVQDHKQIAIRDKKTGVIYSGVNARQMLGLPYHGTVKVVPGNHGGYDIFIQSTSVNRKLVKGTQVMYWDGVGQNYSGATTLVAAQPTPVAAPVAPTRIVPVSSAPVAVHSAEFVTGYKLGFEAGKAKSSVTSHGTGDVRTGYERGYKDGRGKQKRLYK